MKIVIENYKKIKDNIEKKYPDKSPNIIAVSKTFPIEHIQPLINLGHLHYGENKVQEAMSKWTEIKKINRFLKLHMIGKLQSNKAKDAVKLFDFIHSLDNEKLALKLSNLERDQEKKIKYFIQVNLGNESQKSGISKSELKNFYEYSKKELSLDVIGLMCIPPQGQNVEDYFSVLRELNSSLGLKDLSMGMTSDYIQALKYNANYLRIGSAIFGARG